MANFSSITHAMPVDAIILTYTANQQIYDMTQKCIDTLRLTTEGLDVKITLVETDNKIKPYVGIDELILPFVEFNYNQYLNFALKDACGDYVLILNNDLVFENEWLYKIIGAMAEHDLHSACPRDPYNYDQAPYETGVTIGWDVGILFCGWCIVLNRVAKNLLYPLDESFNFWFQDNDMARILQVNECRHGLVGTSHVQHLKSQSHTLIPETEVHSMTHGAFQPYIDKWKTYD